MKRVNVGIIGGGLMGKEAASAFGRWFALIDYPVQVALKAVCDLDERVLSWYSHVPTVTLLTTDHRELLSNSEIEVVYVALPHHLHRQFYLEVLASGKDLLAEKPFGMNLQDALEIEQEARRLGRFVRCSSEMPFLPGPQRVLSEVRSGSLGQIIEVKAGFLHSSDLDPTKIINWKRQVKYCGEIGVMGDLGMHVLHLPLRLGWKPQAVYAQLQGIITKRPDGRGGLVPCDTWNNATLCTQIELDGEKVPMILETKRIAPGETNTWYIEVLGTRGGVKYSTKDTKALWVFKLDNKDQVWQRTDLGFKGVPFPTITGGIFEPGFSDCFMQMLAAYFAERAGKLNGRLGCVTPAEAVESHRVFEAALKSFASQTVERIDYI